MRKGSVLNQSEVNMAALCLCLLLCLAQLTEVSWAYPDGAPSFVCDSMAPNVNSHSSNPQESECPYKLDIGQPFITAGESVTLKLDKKASSTPDFRGFLVEAVDVNTNQIYGTFTVDAASSTVKKLTCSGSGGVVVTHTNKNDKASVSLTWQAPLFTSGSKTIQFYFTVVQVKNTYWVKKPAGNQLVVQASTDSSAAAAEPANAGEPEGEPEGEAEGEAEAEGNKHESYDGCLTTKGCFGQGDDDCVTKGNCKLMATYQHLSDSKQFKIRLHADNINANNYVAMGISQDGKMGEDLVLFCKNGGTTMGSRWNSGKNNRDGLTGVTFTDTDIKTVNQVTTCDFILPDSFNVVPPGGQSTTFNLAGTEYHLLLATGNTDNSNLVYHGPGNKVSSGAPIDLKASSLVQAAGEGWLVQVHGCLMVLAWLASAASGMLMARYYKKTWVTTRPFDKDLWFRLHQLFMGSTVVVTIVAFFVIVSNSGWLPYDAAFLKANPHPAIGMVCVVTALIQPMMAALRPHPGASLRWLFNWAHWLVGNTAFLFGMAAIYLAVELEGARLPKETTHVLLAFVVVHVLTHLVLTFQRCHTDHHPREVKDSNGSDGLRDGQGASFRKVVAFLYLAFVWIFAISISILILVRRGQQA